MPSPAATRGARIFTNTNVEKINLKNGRVHEVVTNQGTIQTEIVVNASWGGPAGGWALENLRSAWRDVARFFVVSFPAAASRMKNDATSLEVSPSPSTCFVDLAVDPRDLAKPDVTFFVFHVEDVVD